VYARIVGTIGLLVALPNLVQWLVIAVGNDALNLGLKGNEDLNSGLPVPGAGPTPPHRYRLLTGVVLDTNQIAVFAVAFIAAIVLWLVIRHSRAGLEMRAVVDRETLAGLRGVNAARTSAFAWVMTMILAGFGGVLIAPIIALQDTLITFVVLGSLAAVVAAGFRSIPIAFAAGLALGLVETLFAGYSDEFLPHSLSRLSGLQSAVPYFLVLILLLLLGRDRSRRAGSVADERPRPDHREGLPAWRKRLPWVIFTIALVGFSMQWLSPSWLQADAYDQTVIAQSLVMGIIFLSFVVVTGMGGMVSLAQASFVTAGGFAAGWALNRDWGIDIPGIASHGQINFVWALAIGTLCAAGLGALFAWPVTRLGGVALALGTLALAFFLYFVPFATDPIGKGQLGWNIRIPTLDVPGLNWIHDLLIPGHQSFIDLNQLQDQILVFLVLFGIVTLVIHALQRSASGRAMLAVRSTEVAAEASGVRANRTKILIFTLSAAIAGFGGVLLGLFSFTFSNTSAPPYVGLFWLALAVTFGIRRPAGALLAGFAFAAGPAVFHWIASWEFLGGGTVNSLIASIYFVPILSGLGAIQLAQEPDGILALVGQQRLTKKREKQRQARIAAAEAAEHDGVVPDHEMPHAAAPVAASGTTASRRDGGTTAGGGDTADMVLSMQGIVAGYGDAEVLHGVSLGLERGKVVALLGANGAGKSTLCSVAAGLVDPTVGSVLLAGNNDITHASSFQRARQGLLLVPEARGIFPGLTVEENINVLLRDPALREKAYARFPILDQRRKQVAGLLSGGEQQMLSLAPALADPPAVLIADEPTLGLAPLAAETVMQAIVELREAGTAVLLVEEHAQNALKVADTMAFMELGTIVWIGPRAEADMELLASAYLGGSH
jgi:ABC-type branched-subunit amino acid transport system ATPase component/ABC-type branched-subunit amino acid transport system permease subunit